MFLKTQTIYVEGAVIAVSVISGDPSCTKRIEYILEGNLLEKKCKTAILLYCFHTAGVLHIFMLYNLLGPRISFYRKSKINVKRKLNFEIGWFHN